MIETEFNLVLGMLEIDCDIAMNDIIADIFVNLFGFEGVDFN